MMRLLGLAALALALAVPAQAATTATAAGLEVRGALEIEGDMQGLLLRPGEGGIEKLHIAAQAAQMLRWSREGAYVDCAAPCTPVQQSMTLEGEPERIPAAPVRVQMGLLEVQASQSLLIVPGPDALIRLVAPQAEATATDGACVTEVGITAGEGSGATGECTGYMDAQPGFSELPLAGPIQLLDAPRGGQLVVRGDMALELRGIALRDGELLFDTRGQDSGGTAGTYTRAFGRILLEDATVTLSFLPGTLAQWAMASGQTLALDGHVQLTQARGTIHVPGGERTLGPDDAFAGDFLLTSVAGQDGIGFSVEPRRHDGSPIPPVASPPAWGLPVLAAASLLPLIGVALAVRRSQLHASMRHVEAALRAGRYRRATRLSQRILRSDPRHETAQLGRAIALTRGGHCATAVAGLQEYLSHSDPADGSLHYVLGMALLEMERPDEAHEALQRAASKTPALLEQIAPHLRPSDTGYT